MEITEEKKQERAVLAGLATSIFSPEENATESTMEELEALLETAGGICVGSVFQSRPAPDARTFLGEGKAEEIRDLAERNNATLIVLDNEISPSQMRALQELTGCTVLDRSGLILDIFAQRARTNEGKLQVSLAQYQYILPRLSGLGKSMSRLGGGIGTRGPGESKLESDRRHIRRQIDKLKEELEAVRKVRAVQRRHRQKNETPLVSIIGYTNAGKSTLLNTLTDAGIQANNRLFDTLDPTTRRLKISDTKEVLLSDTVGFIQKLPHHLVDAFRATLEELVYADLLLHVIDLSSPEYEQQAATVRRVVEQLGAGGIPSITVYNKADLCPLPELLQSKDSVVISAKKGLGIPELLARIEQQLDQGKQEITVEVPYREGWLLDLLHQKSEVRETQYTEKGTRIRLVCDAKLYAQIKSYQIDGES